MDEMGAEDDEGCAGVGGMANPSPSGLILRLSLIGVRSGVAPVCKSLGVAETSPGVPGRRGVARGLGVKAT